MARRLPNPKPKHDPLPSLASGIPSEARRRIRPLVRIVRCSTSSLDRDNLYGSVKPLVDQLRYSGLIPGDREDQIDLEVQQIKVKKENVGTWIEILK